MEQSLKVLAIAGSLRKGSYNKALVSAAVELKPDNMEIEVFDLEGIPFYNADWDNQIPQIVVEFKNKIQAADALLIATPEYNYSISGVLKNAIDWASRPNVGNPLEGKPVAIMSASTGRFGGARAQYHLRQTFVFLNMHPVNKPEIMVSDAVHNFDEDGKLTNETTRKLIVQLLEALASWTKQLSNKQQNQTC
jgi:chromate reductase, NAD(P)H dehydrogenase (quinone)